MSDKEKLEAIKNGQDIELDGVTVLQSTSFAKNQEEKKVEVDVKDEIKPDVVVTPEAESVTSETPVEPAPSVSAPEEQPSEVPPIPINIDAIASSLGSEQNQESVPNNADLNANQVNKPTIPTPVQDFTVPSFDTPSMSESYVNLNEQNSSHIYETEDNKLNDTGLEDVLEYISKTRKKPVMQERKNAIIKTREEAKKFVHEIFKAYPSDDAEQIMANTLGDEADVLQLFVAQLKNVDDYGTSSKNHEKDSVLFELYDGGISIDEIKNPDMQLNASYSNEINKNNQVVANGDYHNIIGDSNASTNSFNPLEINKFNDDQINNGNNFGMYQ